MEEGFMIGSEHADRRQKRDKELREELEQYVLENPGHFAAFAATGKATAADFAMTMRVDLASCGEGAAEGSVKGYRPGCLSRAEFHPRSRGSAGSKTLLSRAV